MRELIIGTLNELVGKFVYFDRVDDWELPDGAIQECIAYGLIAEQEIIDAFVRALRQGLEGR